MHDSLRSCSALGSVVSDPALYTYLLNGSCVRQCAAFQAYRNVLAGTCVPCTANCPLGQYMSHACNETSDIACSSCAAGSFRALLSDVTCTPCKTTCPAGFYLIPCLPGDTGRVQDSSCLPCAAGTFSLAPNGDTFCKPIDDVCPRGQFISSPGTSLANAGRCRCPGCSAF